MRNFTLSAKSLMRPLKFIYLGLLFLKRADQNWNNEHNRTIWPPLCINAGKLAGMLSFRACREAVEHLIGVAVIGIQAITDWL